MLALPAPSPSPLGSIDQDGSRGEMDGFSIGADEFPEYFSGGNLLDSIDFDDDDLFIGIDVDGDVLPDLEMDFAEFSSSGGEESVSEMNMSSSVWADHQKLLHLHEYEGDSRKDVEEEERASGSGSGPSLNIHGASKKEKSVSVGVNPSHKRRKSSVKSKNHQVLKRKVKVDWTPELHRRFVQAVEQLGVDKAVPSRILEIMGIEYCLTRHNIASHLQKYRSHRKHLQAREAEAASWSQRRQMYGAAGGRSKSMSPWIAPATIGFPPMTPVQHFRPLHVWGHPSMDQSLKHMIWPKHLVPSPSPSPPPPPAWVPTQRVGNSVASGTPCFLPPLATTRFPAPPLVPGIPPPQPPPPHAMYRVEPGIGIVPTRQTGPHPPADFHPSKESIDAAIGDVVSKPWLPLPLGLKPPSLDSVLVELQRHGIPKIPPPH